MLSLLSHRKQITPRFYARLTPHARRSCRFTRSPVRGIVSSVLALVIGEILLHRVKSQVSVLRHHVVVLNLYFLEEVIRNINFFLFWIVTRMGLHAVPKEFNSICLQGMEIYPVGK